MNKKFRFKCFSKKTLCVCLILFFLLTVLGYWPLKHFVAESLLKNRILIQSTIEKHLGFHLQFAHIDCGLGYFSLNEVVILDSPKPVPFLKIHKIQFYPKWIPWLLRQEYQCSDIVLEGLEAVLRWDPEAGVQLLGLGGESIPASVDYPAVRAFLRQQGRISMRSALFHWQLSDQVFQQHWRGSLKWLGTPSIEWQFQALQSIHLPSEQILPESTLRLSMQSNQSLDLKWSFEGGDLRAVLHQVAVAPIAAASDLSKTKRSSAVPSAPSSAVQPTAAPEWHSEGRLSLKALDLETLHAYALPHLFDSAFSQWSMVALQGGQLKALALDFEGPLSHLTWTGQGTYQKVNLQYHPDWPAITEAKGLITLKNQGVSIALAEGLLQGLPLYDTSATIHWSQDTQPLQIQVDGACNATFEEGLRFLELSPLRAHLYKALAPLSLAGTMQLHLGLGISIPRTLEQSVQHSVGSRAEKSLPAATAPIQVAVKGLLSTPSANALLVPGLACTDVQGEIQFTEDSLRAKDLGLNCLGFPLKGNLNINSFSHHPLLSMDLQGLSLPLNLKMSLNNPKQYLLQSPHFQGKLSMPSEASDPWVLDLDYCLLPDDLFSIVGAHAALTAEKPGVSTSNATVLSDRLITAHADIAVRSSFLESVQRLNKPAFKLNIQALRFRKHTLGGFTVQLSPKPYGYAIHNASLEGDQVWGSAEGEWHFTGPGFYTKIKGHLEGLNIGKVLADLGYHANIREASGLLHYDLKWPDHPWSAERQNIQGSLNLKLDKGRIMGMDAGLGRLMGLLNLENIKRRLQFDFSDLYKKGFVFDTLSGSAVLNQGILKTETVRIDGPSAKIQFSGTLNLESQALDLSVDLSPRLGAGLPMAAALAAGHPAIGAGVWVIHQLSGKLKMNRMAQQHYQVGGTWDVPIIESVKGKK